MSIERAVILAAGKGKRLGALTADVPKPLVEVAGRPLLHRILVSLRGAGVRAVRIVTGYKWEKIRQGLGDGSGMGLVISYCEQPALDGTGAAVLAAADFISEPAFLSFGDILLHPPEHYRRIAALFAEQRPDGVLAANWVPDPCVGGAVYSDETGTITRIVEKPAPGTSATHYNQAGCFVFGPSLVAALEKTGLSPRGEIELTAGVEALLRGGARILAHPVPDGQWLDIGTPESLARANAALSEDRHGDT